MRTSNRVLISTQQECIGVRIIEQRITGYAYLTTGNNRQVGRVPPGEFRPSIRMRSIPLFITADARVVVGACSISAEAYYF